MSREAVQAPQGDARAIARLRNEADLRICPNFGRPQFEEEPINTDENASPSTSVSGIPFFRHCALRWFRICCQPPTRPPAREMHRE